MKSISVIIPNYNGEKLLKKILPALQIALLDLNDYEIIVVDDCSEDNSIDFLSTHYPEILVLKNEENKGFSSTANRGLNHASKELVFLMNSDVKLLPNYFLPQFKYFDNPNTFGVNGTIINWDDDNYQGGGKILRSSKLKIKCNLNYYINDSEYDKEYQTMFLSGTNALIDRKKFLILKGFDELFNPFYVEDIELSIRALRAGWLLFYEPESVCRHQMSTTIQSYHKKRKIQFLNIRNKFYMHAIHLEGIAMVGWFVRGFFESFFRIFILNFTYIKAYFSFLANFRKVMISKRNFKEVLKGNNSEKQDVGLILNLLEKSINDYKIDKVFY